LSKNRPDESDDFNSRSTAGYDNQGYENIEFQLSNNNSKLNLSDSIEIANKKQISESSSEKLKNLSNEKKSNKKVFVETFLSFMCGFENNEIGVELQQTKKESKRRVENFYSLNQSRKEKIVLYFNLVLICLIAIGLYVFFSIPPEKFLFGVH
jgi:hypothetical protein